MIKTIGKVTLVGLLAAMAMGMPARSWAQDPPKKNAKTAAKPAAPPKAKTTSFTGKLAAADKVAKTLTLDEKAKRVLDVTSETIITKNGKPATFDDAVLGEEIHGTFKKTEDGKLIAVTVNYGAKSTSAKAPPAKKTPPEHKS